MAGIVRQPLTILIAKLKNEALAIRVLNALELEARREATVGTVGTITFDVPGGRFLSWEQIDSGDDDDDDGTNDAVLEEFLRDMAIRISTEVWKIKEHQVNPEEIKKIIKILRGDTK
jgi:hypothetical protein